MYVFVSEDHMLDWHSCQICYPLEISYYHYYYGSDVVLFLYGFVVSFIWFDNYAFYVTVFILSDTVITVSELVAMLTVYLQVCQRFVDSRFSNLPLGAREGWVFDHGTPWKSFHGVSSLNWYTKFVSLFDVSRLVWLYSDWLS